VVGGRHLLRHLGVLGLVSLFCPFYALGQLGVPIGEKPSGPEPTWTEYRWTTVPGAEYYMLRLWVKDQRICSSAEQPAANSGESRYNPYVSVFPALLCNEEECGIRQDSLRGIMVPTTKNIPMWFPTSDKVSWNAARAEVSRTAGQAHGQPGHSAPGFIPVLHYSRNCSEKFVPPPPARCGNRDDKNHGICEWGSPRNGPLIEWKWTIQALAGWDSTTETWAKKGAQSSPVMYTLAENVPPQPPPKPAPPPKSPHPITFLNNSGIPLYIYYKMVPAGSRVDCHYYDGGEQMGTGQLSQQFTVPGNLVGYFVFQKAAKPCDFDVQYTTRQIPGGVSNPETVSINAK